MSTAPRAVYPRGKEGPMIRPSKAPAGANWIGAIEASYRLSPRDEEWLDRILACVEPELDAGLGVYAFLVDARQSAFRCPVARNPAPGWHEMWTQWTTQCSAEMKRRGLASTCCVMSTLFGGLPEDEALFAEMLEARGMLDSLVIVAADPTDCAAVLTAALPSRRTLSLREKQRWARLAAHIAAGLRLRRQRGALPLDPFAGAEAILDASGRALHAEAPAKAASREILRDAALAMDRATRVLHRGDPDEAIALWRALLAGRWSLVDHEDRDGRRYFICFRNDPEARGPEVLTRRECQVAGYAALGHSNKLIAYELGLAPGTIAYYLATARTKLRASSRTDLIRRLTAPLDGAQRAE